MSLPTVLSQPLRLSEQHVSTLIDNVRDWQYQHGSVLKFPPRSGKVIARPIGATVFPSNFPERCFREACGLQLIFNKLYAAIAENEEWLREALKALIESPDSMARILWEIHKVVREIGYVQDLSLGVFRSDYMLHTPRGQGGEELPLEIKQVEFNTYSVAGGAHGNRISNMHKYLHRTGAYGFDPSAASVSLPLNTTLASLAAGLAKAHVAYGSPKSKITSKTAILMVVQPNNVNICDERPIEEALWEQGIPSYRVEFGDAVLNSTSLTATRELLFVPPTSTSDQRVEISVVYQRAGYDEEEYTESGLEARYQLELSRAIKAPSLLCHLATLKVVQQKLAMPNVLELFLDAEEAAVVRKTFAPMYPLNDSELGKSGCKLALNAKTAGDHVLKPSQEGGGHNIYRDAIPSFLKSIPKERWADYILMEMIEPPAIDNILVTFREVYSGPVISELGVYGTCLWRKNNKGKLEVTHNSMAGTSMRTKRAAVDEISVVKGYGCFDSPCLV